MITINLLLVLLSAGALATPTEDPAESKALSLSDIFHAPPTEDPTEKKGLSFNDLFPTKPKKAPIVYEPLPKDPNELTDAEKAALPKWSCTYQVSYKMLTYFLFGDNWNVSKATIKAACEKSRTMNHWSYREWQDDNGDHFCAKVSFFFRSVAIMLDSFIFLSGRCNFTNEG